MRASSDPLEFSCSCGQMQGHISANAVKSGTHAECSCRDCRAAELYFDQTDPAPGPVDLFQTTPDAINIAQGAEHLGLMRLSPKGTMRWFAKCCDVPMFNTTKSAKFPFVGIKGEVLKDHDRIGKVVSSVFIPRPGGKPTHKGMGRLAFGVISRMIAARLSGRWRQTPFFDVESGRPVAEPVLPSKEQRAGLYPPQRRTKG